MCLQWLSITLCVLASFPKLITAPEQMETLWNADESQLQAEILKGDPICSKTAVLEGMDVLLHCMSTKPYDECLDLCEKTETCKKSSIAASALGVNYCLQMGNAVGTSLRGPP